jgi:hypothetical protein
MTAVVINITKCTFINDYAYSGLGNDIYVDLEISYPSSLLSGSCSDSDTPKITILSQDNDELLPSCVVYTQAYIATDSNTPKGKDGVEEEKERGKREGWWEGREEKEGWPGGKKEGRVIF